MKIRYLLVLLVIMWVSSCATETAPEAPSETPPVAEIPPAEPEPPAEEPTEVVEPEPIGPTSEIEVMYAGYEPKELTVQKGTTLVFKSIQGKHKLTLNGKGQDVLEEDGTLEYAADTVGDLKVFDIFTKKSMTIQVVEELEEATE